MKETWGDILGYEGYYKVSSLGLVKSISRVVKNGVRAKRINGRILKMWSSNTGYLYVTLSKGGIVKKKIVHILVAQAFIKNPYKKPQINHIDGVKSNNYVDNLEWSTAKENSTHKIDVLGKHQAGMAHHNSKLTNNDIINIRKMYNEGIIQPVLAIKYAVRQCHISDIVNNKKWKIIK